MKLDPVSVIAGAIKGAVREVALDPAVPELPREAADAVETAIRNQLARNPIVQHATNAEPWYRSNVTLGSLQTILASLAALLGMVSAGGGLDWNTAVPAVWAIIGAAQALYGRWAARAPIGAAAD